MIIFDFSPMACTTPKLNILVHPVDDPAIIIGDFNQSILEDGTARGDINATDADGLSDDHITQFPLILSMVMP